MTLQTLSKVLTTAIVRLEDELLSATEAEVIRKTAHALATVCGAYRGLAETADLEQRIAEMEARARGEPLPARGRDEHASKAN